MYVTMLHRKIRQFSDHNILESSINLEGDNIVFIKISHFRFYLFEKKEIINEGCTVYILMSSNTTMQLKEK